MICHPEFILLVILSVSEGSGILMSVEDSSLRCASLRMTTSSSLSSLIRILLLKS